MKHTHLLARSAKTVLCRSSFRRLSLISLALFFAANASLVHARLEVCNQTDLVLMVAIGYDTPEKVTVTEGWWRVYPGFCEVPVDVALFEGKYFIHAESNPRSTMPDDGFNWGEQEKLCVQGADFSLPDGKLCSSPDRLVGFNVLEKNWRNDNTIDIFHKRKYKDQFAVKAAGIQRLLSVLGFDMGDIDGVIGKKTVAALNQVGFQQKLFGLDFRAIYPMLENLIAEQHQLNN